MRSRRNFFKEIGVFAAGVIGAKVASSLPKKDTTPQLKTTDVVTVRVDEKEYNIVVVDKSFSTPFNGQGKIKNI